MKNNQEAAQSPKELLNELQALVIEAEKMMGESISEHTEDAMNGLRSRFDAAHERLGVIYDGAKRRVVSGDGVPRWPLALLEKTRASSLTGSFEG